MHASTSTLNNTYLNDLHDTVKCIKSVVIIGITIGMNSMFFFRINVIIREFSILDTNSLKIIVDARMYIRIHRPL